MTFKGRRNFVWQNEAEGKGMLAGLELNLGPVAVDPDPSVEILLVVKVVVELDEAVAFYFDVDT